MNCECNESGYCQRHGMKVTLGLIARCKAGKFKKPTLGEAAVKYVKSTARHVSTGFQLVSLEVREKRQVACNSCPHNVSSRCDLCNCPLDKTMLGDKLARASEKCPLGKW